MSGPGLFAATVIGLLAGALARALIGGERSVFAGLVAGVAGALLGTSAAALLGLEVSSAPALALAALAGATGLLAVLGLMPKR